MIRNLFAPHLQLRTIVFTALVLICAAPVHADAVVARLDEKARRILEETAVQGGLIVHLGCGEGGLAAALCVNESYLVHGLDSDPEMVRAARQHIRSLGLYGPVSADLQSDGRLPYADNLVNLVVAEELGRVTPDELMRVLCPRGVAYIKYGDTWRKQAKPWPEEIDEWTHCLHSANNNAIADDAKVGPPKRIQWVAGPRRARQHEHLASVSTVVSADGRIFSIQDEGSTASALLPAKWFLVARDAFNGLLLWKKPVGPWERHLRGFRSGPPDLSRRLVAVGQRVYVTLGYGKPVCALDAATGELVQTFEGTEYAREILHDQGVLFLVAGNEDTARAAEVAKRRGETPPAQPKRLIAVRSDTGQLLWEKTDADTADLMPATLAVAEDRVFFQNAEHVICLEAGQGHELWRYARSINLDRPPWSTPNLVVYRDVVLSADRAGPGEIEREPDRKHRLTWIDAPVGQLIAISAKTGKELWTCPCREGFNASVDVLVADGLVWTGELASAEDPGITAGRDPLTGEIKRKRPADQAFYQVGMPHHRCYRNRGTNQYLILGRAGVELVDLSSGQGIANHWIRGTCQFGVLPCNGLLYTPPHSCACYLEAKLNGFYALAAEQKQKSFGTNAPDATRLERGPAYGRLAGPSEDSGKAGDWPTYRHDEARSGCTESAVPSLLRPAWQADVGGRLSGVTIADGKVFVASIDKHTVHALDAENGQSAWHFTAGGRIDSPPTIYQGMALFGSADGYLYCLRASDGQVAWRFHAAPESRFIVASGQLESSWPIHGSVLVWDHVVTFAAGRSSYLDGGIQLYRVDATTGEELSRTCIDSRDPRTGYQPKDAVDGFDIPGALPDILSADDEFLYMRQLKFDRQGTVQTETTPHLFCPTGLLDDTWWHRSYWILGTRFYTGYRDWFRAGREVPAGRLLVFDQSCVYGFGLKPEYYYWSTALEYHLFATDRQPEIIESPQKRQRVPAWGNHQVRYQWSEGLPVHVRAMVLADRTLFVAGPPSVIHEQQLMKRLARSDTRAALNEQDAALEGKKGGLLWVVSAEDGKKRAEYKIDSPPVFDGMAAANGRLCLSTADGKVLCFAGE